MKEAFFTIFILVCYIGASAMLFVSIAEYLNYLSTFNYIDMQF
jgi:hypothetical protein